MRWVRCDPSPPAPASLRSQHNSCSPYTDSHTTVTAEADVSTRTRTGDSGRRHAGALHSRTTPLTLQFSEHTMPA